MFQPMSPTPISQQPTMCGSPQQNNTSTQQCWGRLRHASIAANILG
jgi:hypothetical protein